MLAYRAGASRVELNSDLFHGGLTPTLGSLIAVKKAAPALEIMAMVRPREGGFCYTDTEYAVMKEDAQLMLEHGTDGIVSAFCMKTARWMQSVRVNLRQWQKAMASKACSAGQ